MSGWTAPRTWATGDQPTSAQMNTELRDNLLALLHPLGASHVDADVVNTASEWSLFNANPSGGITVPGGALGANGTLYARFECDALYNAAATNKVTLRLRLAGTALIDYTTGTTNAATSATRVPIVIEAYVAGRNSQSSQLITVRVSSMRGAVLTFGQTPGTVTTGIVAIDGNSGALHLQNTGTADLSIDQVFDLTAQWDGASASLSFRKRAHRVYVAQAA